MKCKKGVTLIEVLIIIAIISIIITPISLFFISNYKALLETEKRIDLKSEGQKALQIITEAAMDSEGIESIKEISPTEKNVKLNTPLIIINNDCEVEFKGNAKKVTFIKGDKITLNLGIGSTTKYINEIIIKDISTNLNIGQTNVIEVSVSLKNGKIEEELKTKVAFRNMK